MGELTYAVKFCHRRRQPACTSLLPVNEAFSNELMNLSHEIDAHPSEIPRELLTISLDLIITYGQDELFQTQIMETTRCVPGAAGRP